MVNPVGESRSGPIGKPGAKFNSALQKSIESIGKHGPLLSATKASDSTVKSDQIQKSFSQIEKQIEWDALGLKISKTDLGRVKSAINEVATSPSDGLKAAVDSLSDLVDSFSDNTLLATSLLAPLKTVTSEATGLLEVVAPVRDDAKDPKGMAEHELARIDEELVLAVSHTHSLPTSNLGMVGSFPGRPISG